MKRLQINKKKILRLGWPFLVLLCLSLIIVRERIGVKVDEATGVDAKKYDARLYEVSDEAFSSVVEMKTECLVINNSEDFQCEPIWEQLQVVLSDMRVGYDVVDLSKEALPDLSFYDKVVLNISDLSALKNDIVTLCDWVKAGGCLMNTGTFQNDEYFDLLGSKAGILNSSEAVFTMVTGVRILNDFMINANDREFTYTVESDTALNVALSPECLVYLEERVSKTPLLWEKPYGEGEFVITNQVLLGKVSRGFLSAAYSLLGDAFAYPVINGSTFYLDDFPSPIPEGNGQYITEEFGVGISTFYSNIWWPDMLRLQKTHGLIYTGLIIVEYSDKVEGPFEGNKSTERYTFFGNILLNHGGELGFHGYNHMPLCMDNYDYKGMHDEYNYWPSVHKMEQSLEAMDVFSKELFPEERFSVYVPPSNILSKEGRDALKNSWDDLLVIASTYHEHEVAYTQEFEVAEDGIVETPRIASGCIFDEYMMLAVFSELNFHYVQTYFLHPDDALDEDRGAKMGWSQMYENLTEYVDYIYKATPNIRNLSGTGLGEAVREFDKLSVQREETENMLYLSLGGFYEDAYFMVRMSEGTPGNVTGGTIEHLTGELYLLHATEAEIRIEKVRE